MSHSPTFSSIAAALETRARQTPERVAYTFLGEGLGEGSERESLTYRELEERARGVADFLVGQDQAGERVLLLYPPGLDFIAGFFGCLYAGSVAVPAYPPGSRRTLPRVRAIARDAQATVALTTRAHVEKFEALSKKAPELAPLTWKGTDGLAGPGDFSRHEPRPEEVAFLQYTSGSTAAPKGVMVTHGNLVHNEEMIRQAFDLTEESVIAGWLPLYHDMGLIGNVLQPLWTGSSCVLMSPISFLRQPRRWLETIHEYRATTSGGPNFAYDLCVRRIPPEEREGLDLSSWTVAFNGAEPVRAETLERFAEAFGPYGFRREAFYPCYGLAEGTLLVSGGEPAEAPPVVDLKPESLEKGEAVPSSAGEDGRRLVGCGRAWQEQRLAVVDEETGEALPEGRVGEIRVSGGSVAAGYWQRPEDTERDFQARLPGDDATWLRTGDLGFLHGGELFVTGRAKDLIILRGRNHYPQDVELTVERCHPDLRPGCGAAFSVDVEGEESLVVVQELVRRPAVEDFQEVVEAAREAVATEHEARLHELVLIRWGSVPKTSSGKIQRRRCRALYLEGELPVVARGGAEAAPGGPGETSAAAEPELDREALEGLAPEERAPALLKHLKARAAQVLRCEPGAVAPEQSLVSLGLDSLAAVELQQAVASDLGVEVGLGELLDGATVASLAEEILSRLEEGEAAMGGPEAGAREGRQPLSRGQAALWFLQRLAPESAAYHITAAADVEGDLDASALDRALGRLTERHELLRATFPAAAGEPVLEIHESLPPSFSVEMAETWTEEELDERSAAEAYRPFDLERGPLLRTVLFRRGLRRHRLVFAVHHLVADFWSLGILTEELASLYGEETDGPAAHLPELGLSYGDYVAWQEERLAGTAGQAAGQHWQNRLGGGVPPLDLPTDRPRPPVQTDAGGRCSSELGTELTDGLRRLAAESAATPFAVAAAGLLALFHRLSGQGQVTLGTPAAGRTAAGLAPLVGYFVNPVVLATEASGDVPFRDFLANLRQNLLDALAHQDFPFPLLAERLQPVRDPSRTPLFQVMLTEQKPHRRGADALGAFALGTEGAEMSLGPLNLISRELPETPVQFDLSFVLANGPEGLGAALQYNRDLFDVATAQRLLERWRILLAGAAEGPELPLGDLPVMADVERRHVLAEINATAEPLPEITLHGLFEAQAAATPGAPALTAPGADEELPNAELTYAELDSRANQLARHLAGLGVGAETIVGVATRRSADMVAALLGILKAGGTYLPLDPAYPKERIAFTLEDSGAAVVVTDQASVGSLEGFSGRVLFLDGEDSTAEADSAAKGQRRPAWTAESPAPLEPISIDPRRLAYVIYTSGSTGRPKGVQIPHRAAVNFLETMARRPGIVAEDVLVAVTTLSFDIAGLELFLPLANGARVVLADRATAGDGAALLELLQDQRATFLQATPSTWRLLLAAGWNGEPRLQALCGGEALPKDLAAQVLARSRSLWNVYGPTETTIWSAVHRVSRESADAPGGIVSIGRPIASTSLYLLDRRGRLTAPGTPGELVIGGGGVARGYLGRPSLTAERFAPDPFSGEPGSRLYRTGDLVRLRPDDRFEYLSRLDHQVKIRGHRIELGEIEAALEELSVVAQAVVTARELRPGDVGLVAYLVAAEEGLPSQEDLREELRERLPEAFLPAAVVPLEALPLTPNGKVDRKALPAPSHARPDLEASYAAPKSGVERLVAEVWAEVLGVEKVGLDDNFFDLGGHSLLVAQVHGRLEEQLGAQLTMVDFFRHPTVRALAGHLEASASGAPAVLANRPAGPAAAAPPDPAETAIAIVGMAGRFPGASSVDALWELLREGREAVTVFGDDELVEAGIDPALLEDPAYVKASGHLEGADHFDAAFFGIQGREAELMDPQHRLFLETAWHGLEDAGYDPGRSGGRIGVFAGVGIQTYAHEAGLGGGTSEAARYQAFIGNDKDFVPTRVSYKLDLKGPSVTVQTACSSSLVAVHLAARSLLSGESDMALAGGVTVRTPLKAGYFYEEGGIPSPDGHCRPFDAEAAGTVFGNGAAVVVLKRLDRALADGDRVRAILRGSAINNDGAGKIGYTAPSVDGQAQVVADALQAAGVSAGSISYVEAHGTGTPLGDPIEVTALKEAFAAHGAALGEGGEGSCALGSVKSNLGHLDTAAGVTGLIKTVLALEHGELPPTLHFRQANPKLGLEGSPFRVAAELEPWSRVGGETPRRAGVSSFGIGGTNAHVILEEAPRQASEEPRREAQLLVLSARSLEALDRRTAQLAEALDQQGDSPEALADAAFTLSLGRKAFEHRRVLVAGSGGDAAEALAGPDPARVQSATAPEDERPVAFLFSGQGSQYPDMGRELYETEPVFRREVDRCCDLLEPLLGRDLRPLLYPEIPEGEPGKEEREEAAERLARTAFTQPALFVVEVALARLWQAWGVKPTAMLGHSIGELVAAHLAGVFDLPSALRLVAARGRLMQSAPEGSMLGVELAEEELTPLLGDDLALATVNGDRDCVAAGPDEAIDALAATLEEKGIRHRRLRTSHAFHSSMMYGILEAFRGEVAKAEPQAPKIPFVSNVTGTWIRPEEATDPAYWSRQIRSTVRFADGVHRLLEEPAPFLLEIGPGRTLSTLARKLGAAAVAPSLPHPRQPEPDGEVILGTLGRLWLAGGAIDWQGFWQGEKRHRRALPLYPFEGKRYWLEARPTAALGPSDARRPDPADWLSVPLWQQAPPRPRPALDDEEHWLVLADEGGTTDALLDALQAGLQDGPVTPPLTVVQPGEAFEKTDDDLYLLRPGVEEDFNALVESLQEDGRLPSVIVHGWSLTTDKAPADAKAVLGRLEESRRLGPETLVALARALERSEASACRWTYLTNGLFGLPGEKVQRPDTALALGPLRVIPQELSGHRCRVVDLSLEPGDGDAGQAFAAALLAETAAPVKPEGRHVALRASGRWLRNHGSLQLEAEPATPRLREGGVYLVTGGLGGLGLAVAEDLARRVKARLALVGRRSLPARETWQERIDRGPAEDPLVNLLQRLLAMEDAGAEVLTLAADVTDGAALEASVLGAEDRFGPLHGVIHAAGIAGGTLLQRRSPVEAKAVQAPKVEGTLVLCDVFKDRDLDFLALFSSVTGTAGGVGQSDYCSANAFQDAVAASSLGAGRYTVAIGWDRWEEVGMAVRSARASGGGAGARMATGHPLLGAVVEENPQRQVFVSELTPEHHWVLSEHLIAGRPTVPGTTFLEMARAAHQRRIPGPVALSEVAFLAPLSVDEGERRQVVTVLEGDAGKRTFRVASRPAGDDGDPWQDHVRGTVAAAEGSPGEPSDLEELARRCGEREITAGERASEQVKGSHGTFLVTGPRWSSLKGLSTSGMESLARLELAPEHGDDLQLFPLHPALMDVAAGAVQFLAEGNFLPLAYERLTLWRPLSRRTFSHLKLQSEVDATAETLTCDIHLLDARGAEVARVEGFSMKRVGEAMAAQLAAGAGATTEGAPVAPPAADPFAAAGGLQLPAPSTEGIRPEEGVAVLRSILDGGTLPQILVTPRELAAVEAETDSFDLAKLAEEASAAGPATLHERPSVSSEFVAPEDGPERKIAEVWQRVLGLEQVGVHDNFFELGGTSLNGVQLVSELKKELGVDIPTVSIFEAPTVSALAKYLKPKDDDEEAFSDAKDRAERKRRALARRPPPRRPGRSSSRSRRKPERR